MILIINDAQFIKNPDTSVVIDSISALKVNGFAILEQDEQTYIQTFRNSDGFFKLEFRADEEVHHSISGDSTSLQTVLDVFSAYIKYYSLENTDTKRTMRNDDSCYEIRYDVCHNTNYDAKKSTPWYAAWQWDEIDLAHERFLISTEDLSCLAQPQELKKICQSIATLDAILCPDDEYRNHFYNSRWSSHESLFHMTNGSGDEMLVLFSEQGACINGFAHESELNGWQQQEELVQNIAPGILDEVPSCFQEFVSTDPVKGTGTTFCVWYLDDKNTKNLNELDNADEADSSRVWHVGNMVLPKDEIKDGSAYLLSILDGHPITYQEFVEDYYEEQIDIALIEAVYTGTILTKDLVMSINPSFDDFNQLQEELAEIGYPCNF